MRAFVYGTLTDPDRVADVLPEFEFVGDAILEGLHRVAGAYPTLAPGGSTRGRLLDTPAVDALDTYEGVEQGLYVRVAVPFLDRPDGTRADEVAVYVGDPDALSVTEEVRWPGDGSFESRVRSYLREKPVRVCAEG